MYAKKIIWLLFFLFLLPLSTICFAEKQRSLWPIPSIKLTGGGRYTAIGDMNTHLNSMNYIYNLDWSGVSGKIENLNNWSEDWEVELKIDLSPQIAFGLAASIFQRRNQSSIYAYEVDAYRIDRQFIFKPEIKIIMPLGFNLYYSVYSKSRLNVFINAGLGCYLAKMKETFIQNAIYPLGDIYFDNRFWEGEKLTRLFPCLRRPIQSEILDCAT